MSPEEQRIAIAEACGYEFRDESARYPKEQDWQKYKAVYSPNGGFIGLCRPRFMCIPHYASDLNAMHEAENHLITETNYYDFLNTLHIVMGRPQKGAWPIRATAGERSEALLKVIGKWKDS